MKLIKKIIVAFLVLLISVVIYMNLFMPNTRLNVQNFGPDARIEVSLFDSKDSKVVLSDSIKSAESFNDEVIVSTRWTREDYFVRIKLDNQEIFKDSVKHLKYDFIYITLYSPSDSLYEERVVVNSFSAKTIMEAIEQRHIFYIKE